jgi:zinc protease
LAAWLNDRLKSDASDREVFRVQFSPALQLGELLVIGEGEPEDAPGVTERMARALRDLAKQPPSADAWRRTVQEVATRTAETTDTVRGRTRAYATAVYLGSAASEVDTAAAGMRQLPLPEAETWEGLTVEAAGRGLVRGTRLARPK